MAGDPIQRQTQRLLAEIECAWDQGAWVLVTDLAADALAFDPGNEAAAAYARAAKARGRREVQQLARSLDCLPVLAFLTDRLNRIQWVNRSFAATVGDPVQDHLDPDQRFLHAAIAGPYRDCFPRWKQELSNCLAELRHEVEAGRLAQGTLRLIDETFCQEADLRRAAENPVDWDGTMLVCDPNGKLTLVQEHVLPLVDASGRPTGLHVTQWFPADRPQVCGPMEQRAALGDLLTPRQLEIARLYASGMTAEDVATAAGISWRTARDHLEEIYSRLDVHSRSELTLQLSRAGLV
jgi:DNA-binding CsgD family transcriptional regulator/PAS domain-containing protein